MNSRFINFILIAMGSLLIGLYSRNPVYNWDMIAYMGVALEYAEPDLSKVHKETYATLQAEVPPKVFADLTNIIEDRHNCLVNVHAFENELSYFRVKPLYTGAVFLLYHLGVPMFYATLLPSLLATFLMLLVVYFWLAMYVKKIFALILALLLGLYPPFRELAQLSSPDAMSNLLILLSLYLIANGKTGWMLGSCIVLSVLCRVDNFLFAGVVVYFVYLSDYGKGKLLLLGSILAVIAIVGIIGIPVLMGDSPDWFLKFAYTASSDHYIQHWRDVLYLFRHSLFYLLFIVVALTLLLNKKYLASRRIAVIVTLSVMLHMILFPSLQERFLVAYEFALIIMLVNYLREKYKREDNINTIQLLWA